MLSRSLSQILCLLWSASSQDITGPYPWPDKSNTYPPSVFPCLTHVLCGAESTPGVQEVELEKRLPCERMLLTAWEQRHCCTLPEDLRQFYMSADGFKLIWNYAYAG